MGKESQLLEASAAGNVSKVENLLQNKSKLKRILSSEKSLDSIEDADGAEEPSLRIMMKKKAPHLDIDTRDDNGASPLILAALNGHCNVVQVLLTYSANVWAVDLQGNSALHFAAWHNRSDIVELLLSNDSEADATNREGNTPLHYACQYCPSGKTLTIVKLLQWSERSILLPNKAGETPFSLAIRFNKKEVVALLVDAEPRTVKETKSIIDASMNGRTEIVETLLDAGMDPNCFDGASGSCPLHEAVRFFRKGTAKILLEFGAACDQSSANGETAIGIVKGHPEAKRDEFITLFLDYKHKSPRIAKSFLEKMHTSTKSPEDADVYITYPLLKNKLGWTRTDSQFCSAWTKQHPNTLLLDNDDTTYWKIPAAGAYTWVAFDLGSEYTLTGLRLGGWGDKQMVHSFFVEVAASLSGPWRQVQKFKADLIGPEDMTESSETQDFRGFYETSRYWKLVVADNFGAPTTCLSEVQFFGVEKGVLDWFEKLGMKSLLKDFIQRGYNQLSDLALLNKFDIGELSATAEEKRKLVHAVSLLREKCFPPTNLKWASKPASKVTTNKKLPDFIVYSDPYTSGELKIVARGGALLGGITVQPLKTKQNGFPSQCTFSGLTIGPPGEYTLEVQSTSDPSTVLLSDPIAVAPPPMRQSELGQMFDDLDKMLQF